MEAKHQRIQSMTDNCYCTPYLAPQHSFSLCSWRAPYILCSWRASGLSNFVLSGLSIFGLS